MAKARIWVLGSLNVDLVVAAERLPAPGETVRGGDLRIEPGGKGANQAVAAARLGADVRLVGAVGRDAFGDLLLDALTSAGVDARAVRQVNRSTGSASIVLLPDGDNSILISPSANAAVTPGEAREALDALEAGDFLLCQLETPLDAVQAALEFARARGCRTMLDPAPAAALPDATLRAVDVLTPNQIEAGALTETPPVKTVDDAALVAERLLARGPSAVVVKMGAQGALWRDSRRRWAAPALPVQARDAVGAGDVFNAALAVALAEGAEIDDALEFANAAAAISVTRPGAQASAPSRDEVESLLREKAR